MLGGVGVNGLVHHVPAEGGQGVALYLGLNVRHMRVSDRAPFAIVEEDNEAAHFVKAYCVLPAVIAAQDDQRIVKIRMRLAVVFLDQALHLWRGTLRHNGQLPCGLCHGRALPEGWRGLARPACQARASVASAAPKSRHRLAMPASADRSA